MSCVAEALKERAAREPDSPLFGFLNARGDLTQVYTYEEFHLRTNLVADALVASNAFAPGEPLLLVYPPGLEFAVGFYAAVKAGLVPVPVAPPASSNAQVGLAKLAHVIADCGARAALTDTRTRDRLTRLDRPGNVDFSLLGMERLSSVTWIATDEYCGALKRFDIRHNPTLFLQYTSGSTREPRGVAVTHDNIFQNYALALDHNQPVGVSWLPHFHDMGLIGYFLWAMIGGGTSYCMSPLDFLRRPVLWLEAITRFRATISTAPNFAFDYCLRGDKVPEESLAGFDLSSLRQLVNAAEPVRASSVNGFLERFASCGLDRRVFSAAFGLAEHTLCVTGGGRVQIDVNRRLMEHHRLRVETGAERSANLMRLVSCGKPHSSVDLRIVDPLSRTLKRQGEIGEIWVDGPSKAEGYWRKPELTEQVFQATLEDTSGTGAYLRTGDMGFLHEGELYVCGRLKDMVVVHGQNIYPNDVEAFVETTVPELVPGSVAVFGIEDDNGGEGIAVLIEAKGTALLPGPADIAERVRHGCRTPVRLVAVVVRGAIVRTSSGKISRGRTRERWCSGQIEIIDIHESPGGPARQQSIEHYLEELFRLGDARGDDGLTLEQLGIDSFELVTLSLHLQEFIEINGLSDGTLPSDVNDLRVIQSLTIAQIRELLAEVGGGTDVSRLNDMSARTIEEVISGENELIHEDAQLPDAIVPASPQRDRGDGGILITGATGFLGKYLLAELLQRTDREIHVLVRAQDRDHGRSRIEAALAAAGCYHMAHADALWRRANIVCGDLARPRLGLDDAAWAGLAHQVSSIYHSGAEVDYVRSYRSMRAANVLGTREVLHLACADRPKVLHHMSSTFVFGWCALPRLLEVPYPHGAEDRDFGYAQSKWASEQLVYEAAERGLDARVYRSSLVTASDAGHYIRSDIVARVLGYMIRYGISTDAANQMSFLPVDHCARNIAAISLLDTVGSTTYHVTADAHYTIGDVCGIIADRFGYRFDFTDMDGFAAHMQENCGPDDELYPLKPFITGHVERVNLMGDKRYDNTMYRHARDTAPGGVPEPPLDDIVRCIVQFLQAEGLVPTPSTLGDPRGTVVLRAAPR